MYNPNSPIINNMMYSGMQPNGCIPSMPIGNIGMYNMGQGYNGGFYTGVYNNYYNPYLQAQIQKQQQEQYKQSLINQRNVMMQMSKTAHAAIGIPVDENKLQLRYQPSQITQQNQADIEYAEIQRRQFQPSYNMQNVSIINEVNKFKKENSKYIQEDMSFEDFCKNSAALLYNINVQQSIAQQRDLSKLYNKNDYSKLINGGSYNNNLFRPEVTLDDMSVFPSLGEKMKKEYAIRRQQFMDAILNNR